MKLFAWLAIVIATVTGWQFGTAYPVWVPWALLGVELVWFLGIRWSEQDDDRAVVIGILLAIGLYALAPFFVAAMAGALRYAVG